MNIMNYVQQYAEQIGGQFTDYDHSKSVVVVPLNGSRYQTVLAITQTSAVSGRDQAVFTSKVCEFAPNIDLKNLLEQNANFDFSKFVLEEGCRSVPEHARPGKKITTKTFRPCNNTTRKKSKSKDQ